MILVGAILALALFYYFNASLRIRREDRKERLRERKEELMAGLLEQLRKKKNEPLSDGPDQIGNE